MSRHAGGLPSLCWMLAGCLVAVAQAAVTDPPRFIVQLKSANGAGKVAAAAVELAAAVAGTNVKLLSPDLGMYTVEASKGVNPLETLAALKRTPGVVFAEVDARVQLNAGSRTNYVYLKPRNRPNAPPPPPPAPFPNDPLYLAKRQWGVTRIKAEVAWRTISSSASVLTCIVDTGVMWNHPDLAANLHGMPANYIRANTDDNGHGTHVAGILGGVGDNGKGIAGTALWADILPCKALDSTGGGTFSSVVRCIDVCRANKAAVINLSVNSAVESQALKAAVRAACLDGAFFVNSAGNSGLNLDIFSAYPASYNIPGMVAVANTEKADKLYPSSNYGVKTVELAAPGYAIMSTILPGYNSFNFDCGLNKLYCYETGTSQAAPFVAGAGALAKAASGGRLTNVQLAKLLMQTSDPVPFLKRRIQSGGIINLDRLIRRVLKVCPRNGGKCAV